MRISNASRISMFLSFVVALAVGCSGGSEPEKLTKDSEPPIPGMVWNDTSESWEMPNQGGGGGEEDPYGIDAYNNQASNDGGDSSSDEVDPYAVNGSSDGGGGGDDYDPYATNSSGDSDPYAVKPSDNDNGYGSDPDPYAVSSSDTSNDSDGGYGDEAYASASSDSGYDAPAGGSGGSGVFADTIEPILRKHCYNCHGGGPRGSKGDLELHTVEAISSANILKAFNPDDSELFYRVSLDPGDEARMPPEGPGLSAQDVAAIESWIKSGASFGGGGNDGGYGGAYATGSTANSRNDNGGGYGDSDYGDDSGRDGDAPQGRRAPPPPDNLAGAATLAFRRGEDTEAMNHLYAQALVNSDAGKEVLSKYKWVKALRRSKLAVRWGVGVKYTAKGGYGGSPRPAGVEQDLPNSDNDRGGSDSDDDAFAAASFENPTLKYYAGDIGDELIIRLENRIERGWYGDILKQELDGALSKGDGDDEFDDYDDDDGGYGRGGGGGAYGGYGGGGGRDGGSSREKPDGDLIEQIMPGVVMIGEASQTVLFKRAKEQGVDLLVIFDVSSEGNARRRIVNTSTRVRLYDVATEKMLKATGSIKNVELQRAREEDPDDETIQLEMDKIFSSFVDKAGYTVEDFPAARNDKVKKAVLGFVKTLIEQPSENPLWKLSEVRFYQSLGLLTDAHVAAANKRIAPDEASKLSNVVDDNAIRTLFASHLVADAEDSSGSDEGPRSRKDGFR